MPFTFHLTPTRNRPIAPSIRIEENNQITIELKQYSKSPINFFHSALYEGIQAQYTRLSLTETNPSPGNTRIWEGTYNENIHHYLSNLTRGKKQLPPITNQETNHATKPTPQTNTLNLFGNLSNGTVSQAENTTNGAGKIPSNDNGRDRDSHSGSNEQSDESGRDHPGTGSDASGKGNSERETTRSNPSQRTRVGQLTIFESSPSNQPQNKEPIVQPTILSPEEKPKGTNFKFDPEEAEKRYSDRIKLQQITEAVKLLKKLESEDRPATQEEQKVLAKFSGFGGVANIAFREAGGEFRPGYETLAAELEEALSKEELHSAKRSTPNAFYTDRSVMQSMYDALSQMGVLGNTIHALEPGCGIGNFMGLAPEAFAFVGVEKESISARISRQLYPGHTIIHKDYKDTETVLRDDNQPLLQDGAFDVVIGNIPFGNIQLPYQDGKSYKIHDYFFLKSLNKLREGGIMAVVTSGFTMDKRDDSVRKLMAEQADLVAAFRLPNQAFANQGTQVLTDILILQKRSPEQGRNTNAWFNTVSVTVNEGNELTPSEEGVHINEYFLTHPNHIIGDKLSIEKQMYARESLQVKLEDPAKLPERLKHLVNSLPTEIYQARPPNAPSPLRQAPKQLVSQEPSQEHIREGSFLLQGRKIQQVQRGEVVDVIQRNKPLTIDGKTGKRIRDYIQVRDAVKQVIQTQKEQLPEEQRNLARQELHRAYDRFVRIHGPINAVKLFETANSKRPGETKITRRFVNVNDLRGDPDIYLVMSIEKYDEKTNQAEKGDIFSKDIVSPKREIIAENPEEGLIVSLQQLGRVDIAYIADICACKEEEVITSLQNRENPLIYFDPEKESYTTREDYLSGNIREKLKALGKFEGDTSLVEINKTALEATLPDPIPYEQVTANLGASWIQPKYIRQFAEENFGGEWNIQFISKNAQWIAEPYGYISMGQEGDSYGVGKLSGEKLFILTLEGKSAKLYKTVSDGNGGDKRVLDREQTLLARQNQEKIRQRFKQWVFEDTDRAEDLAKTYNETFNSVVLRKYEGDFLSFEGMNSGIQLRSHQKDAVYRIMSEDSCLLAHATGAGKTFSMVTAGMSLKKMGLRHKPLYVVPNHMLEQFSREFLTLYPDADILVTTKQDLQKENRKLFTAKAATGDWDAIIMTHSSFNKVGMSPQYQEAFIQKEIESYEELLDYAHTQNGSNRRFIKDIETAKQNLENKLDTVVGQNARSKDQHIFFEELGVDHIFIDEAHAFKNLQIQTKMDRIAGLNTTGSARSLNLFMITEYLNEQDQAGITFATATPITNSLSEMYTMMRYLIPDQMEEMGIQHFDAWAAAFGEVVTRLEIKPDASTIDFQSRFAKFHNVPELLQLFNLATDVKRQEELQ
ncbi:MAG: DEAD/DEAH box helicase family protein, partial [Bacteroidetes bacterium]|nr:DEAD/DEAH box helicase family protein [Bacteroidota bacterium]